jgi:transposase
VKAYSADLRERILTAYNNGDGSQRVLARRFYVSPAFVQNLLRRYREERHFNPKPHGGGKKPLVDGSQLQAVARIVRERPEASLDELRSAVERECDVRLSRPTMCRVRQRLGIDGGRNPMTAQLAHRTERDRSRESAR